MKTNSKIKMNYHDEIKQAQLERILSIAYSTTELIKANEENCVEKIGSDIIKSLTNELESNKSIIESEIMVMEGLMKKLGIKPSKQTKLEKSEDSLLTYAYSQIYNEDGQDNEGGKLMRQYNKLAKNYLIKSEFSEKLESVINRIDSEKTFKIPSNLVTKE